MIDHQRRIVLQGALATGALAITAGTGLLAPQRVLAAWPKEVFEATDLKPALTGLYGSDALTEGNEVQLKAPDIAENGAVVPITVETALKGVTSMAIISLANANPVVAEFQLGQDMEPFVSTRIKMGKTGDVMGLVKAEGKLYGASKPVKVTVGGCGG